MSKSEATTTASSRLSLSEVDLDQIAAGFDASVYTKEIDGFGYTTALTALSGIRQSFNHLYSIRDPIKQAELRSQLAEVQEILMRKFMKEGWKVPERD